MKCIILCVIVFGSNCSFKKIKRLKMTRGKTEYSTVANCTNYSGSGLPATAAPVDVNGSGVARGNQAVALPSDIADVRGTHNDGVDHRENAVVALERGCDKTMLAGCFAISTLTLAASGNPLALIPAGPAICNSVMAVQSCKREYTERQMAALPNAPTRATATQRMDRGVVGDQTAALEVRTRTRSNSSENSQRL